MMRYMLPVIMVFFLFGSGCAVLGNSEDGPSQDVSVYTGETHSYDVQVRIVEVNGRCQERRITLNRKNKLHTRPVVHRVVAHDRNCNHTIDRMEFRDPEDRRRVDPQTLIQDIWHGFGVAVPPHRQAG